VASWNSAAFDVLADADQLVVGGVGASAAPTQAAQQVPDGVVVQHVLLAGVAAAATARKRASCRG